MLKLGPQGKKLLKDGSFEEKFLTKDFPLDFDLIQDIDKFAFD